MSFMTVMACYFMGKGDKKRDKGLVTPSDITRVDNLLYAGTRREKRHLLDVYYPVGTDKPIPTIVSVHGGGWIYGSKEVYQFYCMSLAQRGFTVVNFNYSLAPKHKYPSALLDINDVMLWIKSNAVKYHIDTENLFAVGDSAGAQLLSQYANILTNEKYAKRFSFSPAKVSFKALALNCGVYERNFKEASDKFSISIAEAYLGKDYATIDTSSLKFYENFTEKFPPVYLMTSVNDPLKAETYPMKEFLEKRKHEFVFGEYGEGKPEISHVFHVNQRFEEAHLCNDNECNFFKEYIK